MNRYMGHNLIALMMVIALTLFPIEVSAEEVGIQKAWTERWRMDLENLIGKQTYSPAFPRIAPDGTVYLKNWPAMGATQTDIIAISQDGKLKWTYKAPNKGIANLMGRDYEVDEQGNLYLHYVSGQNITVHKIGLNGKLQAEYKIPSPEQKKLVQRISYNHNGTVNVVIAGDSGNLYFYQLSSQGKVILQKKINQSYKAGKRAGMTSDIEFFGNYVAVHQENYIDIYDTKGNKKFRFQKSVNERFKLEVTKEHTFVGIGYSSNQQFSETIRTRIIGLRPDGKVMWSINATNGSQLYKLRDNFPRSTVKG